MKMRTLRKLAASAPRRVGRKLRGRHDFDVSDATMEPDPAPPPEAVFDRVTGPWSKKTAPARLTLWECDDET
jgi:hypothetical protein